MLATRVEFFWVSKSDERISYLWNSLWAFDGSGVKVWTNLLVEDGEDGSKKTSWKNSDTFKESIYMDLNFYPLTVKLFKGILLGVEQRISLRNSLNCAIMRIESQVYLFSFIS